jgi:hypothetical protein
MANAMSFGHRLEELTDGVTVFQGGVGKPMPLSATTIDIEITAGLALVVTTRKFTNLEDIPIEAILTMPVGFNAVVTGLSAMIDGRRLSATASEKDAARESYETAIDKGKLAVLHEEALRGIHVLSIGQLAPGKEVEVELRTVLPLAISADGPFLRLPMTAGQLYGNTPLQPADDLITDNSVRHHAQLRIRTASGRAILGGVGPVEPGAEINVNLDKAIEILLPDNGFGTVLGASARGRQVRLELSPASVHSAAINTAVLIDRSGSTAESVGDGHQTVLSAMRSGLKEAFAKLNDEDRVALWQFGSDCDHLGTDNGPNVVKLLAKLDNPDGGTNLKDAILQVAASGIHDIVVLTDGQTWEALPPLSAELDIRVSAILVGKASLDANIGHLCAISGGDLFYSPQADVTSSVQLALNSLRASSHLRRIEFSEKQPEKVLRRYNGVDITAVWEKGDGIDASRDFGRFAAAQCLGLLNAAAAIALAIEEGLCTHATSLILIDEAGEPSLGLSETRKVPLMAEHRRILASPRVVRPPLSPEVEALWQQRSAEMRSPKWKKKAAKEQEFRAVASKLWSNNLLIATLEEEPELANWKKRKRKEIDEHLALVTSKIDWGTNSNRLLIGDTSDLGTTEQATLAALKQHQGIMKVIAKSQIEPMIFLLAWLASRYATNSKQAQRFCRKVLKGEDVMLLLSQVDRLVFEAPRLTSWSE